MGTHVRGVEKSYSTSEPYTIIAYSRLRFYVKKRTILENSTLYRMLTLVEC